MVAAGLAAIVLLFALMKTLVDDFSTKWSYIGIVLAGVLAAGAWLDVQAAGGVDHVRSEMSSMGHERAACVEPASGGAPAGPGRDRDLDEQTCKERLVVGRSLRRPH